MKKNLILCPVDYSGSTEPAIGLAAELAKANSSKVVLLHVLEPSAKPLSIGESTDQQFQERLRNRQLDAFDVKYEHVTRRGNPARVIVDFANKHNVDRIVMGTQGRSGLATVLVGSVAKSVMAEANCPVITVKLPAGAHSKPD